CDPLHLHDALPIWSGGSALIWSIASVPTKTMEAPVSRIEMDSLIVEEVSRRPNTCTSCRPLASAKAARTSTATVVTLMPPAVEDDPPPMNIMRYMSRWEAWLMSALSFVENPHDRGQAAMNRTSTQGRQASLAPNMAGTDESKCDS